MTATSPNSKSPYILVLGIGNVLMGDEGIGVHVVRELVQLPLPDHVICLDGGTGSFLLLEPMQQARHVILIDAIDGLPAGRVTRLTPKFSSDYPRTLTAHDIGLKDLLDAAYLTGGAALDVTLFAVSIDPLQEMRTELSPAVARRIPAIVEMIITELREQAFMPDPSADSSPPAAVD